VEVETIWEDQIGHESQEGSSGVASFMQDTPHDNAQQLERYDYHINDGRWHNNNETQVTTTAADDDTSDEEIHDSLFELQEWYKFSPEWVVQVMDNLTEMLPAAEQHSRVELQPSCLLHTDIHMTTLVWGIDHPQ